MRIHRTPAGSRAGFHPVAGSEAVATQLQRPGAKLPGGVSIPLPGVRPLQPYQPEILQARHRGFHPVAGSEAVATQWILDEYTLLNEVSIPLPGVRPLQRPSCPNRTTRCCQSFHPVAGSEAVATPWLIAPPSERVRFPSRCREPGWCNTICAPPLSRWRWSFHPVAGSQAGATQGPQRAARGVAMFPSRCRE